MSTSQIIGAILLAVSALGAGSLKAWTWYKTRPKPAAGSSAAVFNSDAPAPPGVTDYLAMVELTASSASPTLWWNYAKKGLTVNAILRAEVQRLVSRDPQLPEVKP